MIPHPGLSGSQLTHFSGELLLGIDGKAARNLTVGEVLFISFFSFLFFLSFTLFFFLSYTLLFFLSYTLLFFLSFTLLFFLSFTLLFFLSYTLLSILSFTLLSSPLSLKLSSLSYTFLSFTLFYSILLYFSWAWFMLRSLNFRGLRSLHFISRIIWSHLAL